VLASQTILTRGPVQAVQARHAGWARRALHIVIGLIDFIRVFLVELQDLVFDLCDLLGEARSLFQKRMKQTSRPGGQLRFAGHCDET
jgi:hypothetical protein